MTIVGAEERIPRSLFAQWKSNGAAYIALFRPLRETGLVVAFGAKPTDPARVWRGRNLFTATPEALSRNEALFALQDVNNLGDAEPTPADLRGRWQAHVSMHEGVPTLSLTRTISAYQGIRVFNRGPLWTAETYVSPLKARWYAPQTRPDPHTARTLREALGSVLALGLGAVQSACSKRDAMRRGPLDPSVGPETFPDRAPAVSRTVSAVAKRFHVDPVRAAAQLARDAAAAERARVRAERRAALVSLRAQRDAAAAERRRAKLMRQEARRVDARPVRSGSATIQILRRYGVESSDTGDNGPTVIADVSVTDPGGSRIVGVNVGPLGAGRGRLNDQAIRRAAALPSGPEQVRRINGAPYQPGGLAPVPKPAPAAPETVLGASARILRVKKVAGEEVASVEVVDAGRRSVEPVQVRGRGPSALLVEAVEQLRARGAPFRAAARPQRSAAAADQAARPSASASPPAPKAGLVRAFTPGLARWLIVRRFRNGGADRGYLAHQASQDLDLSGLDYQENQRLIDAAAIISRAANAPAAWAELQSEGLIRASSPLHLETATAVEVEPTPEPVADLDAPAAPQATHKGRPRRKPGDLFAARAA